MGVQESKQSFGSSPNLSTGSLRRSSIYKSTTLDQIQFKHELVRGVQSDIDIFAGSRSDERYKELQQILIKTSGDLEQIRRKTNKERTRERCDQVLKEVQASMEKLEAKLAANAQAEKGLDLGAVESNSFINQSFPKTTYLNPELVRSLDDIEFQIQNLEKEVKLAIDFEDSKQFIILEKKITILYGDLVMVRIDDNTPLSERREAFERRLISCNNQIKKCKRKLTKRLSEPAPQSTSSNILDNEDEIAKTEQRLSELELETFTFQGVKTDKRYKELEQILERYWTKLYATDIFTDDERHKRDTAVEKTKNILQELRRRATENEGQSKALQSLNAIEVQINLLKKEVAEFTGTGTDSEYTRLDQDGRRLWANLNEIENVGELVTKNKNAAILDIKNILKELSQNTRKRESQILDEVRQKQLLKQVEEFRNHWEQLNHNLSERLLLEPSISVGIIEMLEGVLEDLRKKTRSLSIIENRKSNASLVITKLKDSSDLNVKYKSAPDLVPQQLGIPENITVVPSLHKTKVIAEMHRIGNDAKTILQQINQTNELKNEDKSSFEDKLNQCKLQLTSLEYNKKSDTIDSSKRRVSKIIEEGFKMLNDKSNDQIRSSSAHEIMDIDAEIQFWRQQIKTFSGTIKDKQYDKIKNGLAESLIKLQVLGDPQVSKQESIQQIQQHHQELERKLAENQAKEKCADIKRQTSQDIKTTIEQVQKLKVQVDRFNGLYNGILYKQIEGNLKSCSEKLDTFDTKNEERLENAKVQTKQKIQKYLTILEEKSVKPEKTQQVNQNLHKLQDSNILKETTTYQRVYSQDLEKNRVPQKSSTIDTGLPHHKINAIREELVVIKEKVETFNGQYMDAEYVGIEKELEGCLERLKSINEAGHTSVLSSRLQYVDYIEKLQQYFRDKTISSELALPGEDEV